MVKKSLIDNVGLRVRKFGGKEGTEHDDLEAKALNHLELNASFADPHSLLAIACHLRHPALLLLVTFSHLEQ